MTGSISYPFPVSLITAPFPPPAPAASTVRNTTDTVVLSMGAQIASLSAQGHSASEIASSLGLSMPAVEIGLGLSIAALASYHISVAPTASLPALHN